MKIIEKTFHEKYSGTKKIRLEPFSDATSSMDEIVFTNVVNDIKLLESESRAEISKIVALEERLPGNLRIVNIRGVALRSYKIELKFGLHPDDDMHWHVIYQITVGESKQDQQVKLGPYRYTEMIRSFK